MLITVALTVKELATITAQVSYSIQVSSNEDQWVSFSKLLSQNSLVKSLEKILHVATLTRLKEENLKMLYRRRLKLREDTQSIMDLEAAYRYLRAQEGTPALHAQVLQPIFFQFENLYTLLSLEISTPCWTCTIFKSLELAHAHYDASMVRQSMCRQQFAIGTNTRILQFIQPGKVIHMTTQVGMSCNYCDNPKHKAHECNLLAKE